MGGLGTTIKNLYDIDSLSFRRQFTTFQTVYYGPNHVVNEIVF